MRIVPFGVVLVLVASAVWASDAVCSAQQTAAYLTQGTDFVLTPKQVDYVIVVDRSGSMQGIKLETVKRAVTSLINQLPANERAALLSFNYNATLHQALTNNHQLIIDSMTGMKGEYGTQYLPPLLLAQEQLSSARTDKALIFLSDGKSDFGETPEEILAITDGIIANNVCIFTVSYALGGDESELLKEIADRSAAHGCGEHFIASEKGTELEEVFSSIHDTLSATELLVVHPEFTNTSYAMQYSSKLNNAPIPGVSNAACSEEPALTLIFSRNGKVVATEGPAASGALKLQAGTYQYKATANLRCGGACSYTGSISGNLTISGTCNPTYTDLATYVTGETQHVSITEHGFSPAAVSGRQGTVVAWTNNDIVARRVTSAEFNQLVEPADTFSYVISNVGTLVYSDPDRNITGSVAPLKGTGTDVLLIMDESGSMRGEGITEARAAAKQFFSFLAENDRGALMTFSQDANTLQEFTSDKSLLVDATEKIVSKGPTNYLSALTLAQNMRPTQRSVLVFMSDGVPTDPEGEAEILAAVDVLRSQGWCIMTVGFGKEAAQAKQLLSAMAGDDQCSAFLYASTGSLTQTFGTIYQLSHKQSDLLFVDLKLPQVTFLPRIAVKTRLETKTGKAVPGGYDVCSPPATVQVRTHATITDLIYAEGTYATELRVDSFIDNIQLIAAVASSEEPGRTFVGTVDHTVVYIPLWLVTVVALVSVVGTFIYVRFSRQL